MVVRINNRLVQVAGSPLTDGDVHAIGVPTVRVNGKPIAVIGQPTTGHGSFPPTVAAEGSDNVRVMGLGVVRAGDAYTPHTDGKETHTGLAAPL